VRGTQMTKYIAVTGILCVTCALLAAGPGCQRPAASPDAATTTPAAASTASPGASFTAAPAPSSPVAGAPTVAAPAGAATALAAVRQDLARRLSLAEAQITLIRAEPVDWPDSSLGCPQPGMMYLQMVTPGYRLVLAAGGATVASQIEYHTDTGGHFVVCQ
jgi:hypothetical protein